MVNQADSKNNRFPFNSDQVCGLASSSNIVIGRENMPMDDQRLKRVRRRLSTRRALSEQELLHPLRSGHSCIVNRRLVRIADWS